MRVLIACEYSGRVRDAFAAKGHDAWSCDLLDSDNGGKHIKGSVLNILDGWIPVKFAGDCLECDMCGEPVCGDCGVHYSDCDHPGPSQDDAYEYEIIEGRLFARPLDNPHWDLMIAHPPCTYLTCSAEWAYKDRDQIKKNLSPDKLYGAKRREAREDAIKFFMSLADAPIEKIAIENPVGVISSRWRKPDCTIQPYEFGEDASKKTCLWLKNLQPLKPTVRFCGRVVEWPRGSGKYVERFSNQIDSGQSNLAPSSDRWKIRSYTYQGWADAMANQWG